MTTDLDAILEYVKQPHTDYAYMLTGPWGCGKTYFWNAQVIPAINRSSAWSKKNRPIPVYVSLYGVKSQAAIHRSILLQLHPKWTSAAYGASVVAQAVSQFFGLDRLASILDLRKIVKLFAKDNRLLICFDDLERSELPVKSALGLINQYVEHVGAKAIILCDEDRLASRADARNYRATKEKVVRTTRRFSGNADAAIDAIIGDFGIQSSYVDYLNAHREEILTLFKQSQLLNLRILKYSLMTLQKVFQSLDSIGAGPDWYGPKLIRTLLPVTFDFQRGDISSEEARQIMADGTRLMFVTLAADESGGEGKSEKTGVAKFIDRYAFFESIGGIVHSEALGNLVVDGHLDETRFKSEIDAADKERDPSQAAVDLMLNDWFWMNPAEFPETVERAFVTMSAGAISDWKRLVRLVATFEQCIKYKLVAYTPEDIKGAFSHGLKVLRNERRFCRIDPWRAEHEVHVFDSSGPLEQWARDALVEANVALHEHNLQAEVEAALDRLDSDESAFAKLITDRQGNGIGDRPIGHFVPPERMLERLNVIGPKAVHRIAFAIKDRFSAARNSTRLAPDVDWLAAVLAGVDKMIAATVQRTPKTLCLEILRQNVDAARLLMHSAAQPQPAPVKAVVSPTADGPTGL